MLLSRNAPNNLALPSSFSPSTIDVGQVLKVVAILVILENYMPGGGGGEMSSSPSLLMAAAAAGSKGGQFCLHADAELLTDHLSKGGVFKGYSYPLR